MASSGGRTSPTGSGVRSARTTPPTGDPWAYFPFAARAPPRLPLGRRRHRRNHRRQPRLCLGLALWNGQDPILKERLFGVANEEGNHGEDVKELYYYLDATPTHSLSEVPLQVPAAHVPIRHAARREPADAVATIPSSNCSTRASSTTTATSTWSWNTRRPGRATSSCGSPRTIADRIPRSFTCCRQLWFRNTWSWETGSADDRDITRRRRRVEAVPPRMGRVPLLGRRDHSHRRHASQAGIAVDEPTALPLHRQRDELARARIRRQPEAPATSRTHSTST